MLCSEISLNIIKINTYLNFHKNRWKDCNHPNHAHQQRMLGLNIILGKLVNYIYVSDSSLKIFQYWYRFKIWLGQVYVCTKRMVQTSIAKISILFCC